MHALIIMAHLSLGHHHAHLPPSLPLPSIWFACMCGCVCVCMRGDGSEGVAMCLCLSALFIANMSEFE